jgi:hypothetical protein
VEEYAASIGLSPPLHPLKVSDFECRRLVTATNAQMYAEKHLIELFNPVWNSDTKICWGLSMHGDTTGRNNSRPPWHVLHPGVSWALRSNIEDSSPAEDIIGQLAAHFAANPAMMDKEHIIDQFIEAFEQDPMVAVAPVDDEAAEGESALAEDAEPANDEDSAA